MSAAHQCKERKVQYQQIVAELHHFGLVCLYYTIEIGCLGHYLKETITSMKSFQVEAFPIPDHCLIEQ